MHTLSRRSLRWILSILATLTLCAAGLYAVAADVHKHTAHQCHKRPNVEHTCVHSASQWPMPDCLPCEECGCGPFDCGIVGGMPGLWKGFKARYLGIR